MKLLDLIRKKPTVSGFSYGDKARITGNGSGGELATKHCFTVGDIVFIGSGLDRDGDYQVYKNHDSQYVNQNHLEKIK